jgi:RNA-directed DNA polymerase
MADPNREGVRICSAPGHRRLRDRAVADCTADTPSTALPRSRRDNAGAADPAGSLSSDQTEVLHHCGWSVSPVLANLFLHYACDLWMTRTHPELPWCRYADDGLVHCRSEQEAQAVRAALQARLAECHLEMHPAKTKIVYCKDGSRKGRYVNQGFDFLGYSFRPRLVKNFRRGSLFWSFTPAVSQAALTAMRETIRETNLRNRTQITLEDVANEINPVLRGWIEYYGRYCPSALYPMFRHVNRSLVAWAMRKYKRLAGHRTRASLLLETISRENPHLFAHWRKGTVGAFA